MSTRQLPTGRCVFVLLGLTRQGQILEPLEQDQGDGRVWFRWEGLRGGGGVVGIEADDVESLDTLHYLSANQKGYAELLATLTCIHDLAGSHRQWHLERIASLLYGTRSKSSHRERQLQSLRGITGLLERAWFRMTPDSAALGRNGAKRSPETIEGQMISFDEPATTRGRTLRCHEGLKASLDEYVIPVPSAFFSLVDPTHHNPEGNLPTLAIKARVRLGAAMAHRMRAAKPQAMRTSQLLTEFAGLDLTYIEGPRPTSQVESGAPERASEPKSRLFKGRGHVREFTEAVWAMLAVTAGTGPTLRRGLDEHGRYTDDEARPLLDTLLRIASPAGVASIAPPSAPRPRQQRSSARNTRTRRARSRSPA